LPSASTATSSPAVGQQRGRGVEHHRDAPGDEIDDPEPTREMIEALRHDLREVITDVEEESEPEGHAST